MMSVFYILMTILLITIITFGSYKLFLVEEVLSEQEQIQLITNLKQEFEYCQEPLNKGSIRNYRVKSTKFNLIVQTQLIDLNDLVDNGLVFYSDDIKQKFLLDLRFLLETDNTIIIKTKTDNDKIIEYKIVTSFSYSFDKNSIIKDFSQKSYANLKIVCY